MAIINTVRGTVTIVGGTATITYPIKKPKPTKNNLVKAVVSAPMNLTSNVTIPKEVIVVPPSIYNITSGYAFDIKPANRFITSAGTTMNFTSTNIDYINRPVTLHLNWGLYAPSPTSPNGNGRYLAGNNIYVNGRTNASGTVTIGVKIPTLAELPAGTDPDNTYFGLSINLYATEPMNPPYPDNVDNKVYFSMTGLMDLSTNQISGRGRTSYVHYNGPRKLR